MIGPFHLRYDVDPQTGCWVWTGCLNEHGYGIVGTNRNGTFKAHRISYERAKGPIPEGKQLDHLCRNRACINPDHLEPVTNAENSRRGDRPTLDWERAREIRRRYAAGGTTTRQLAAAFGVSSGTISKIINHLLWAEERT